ncbi:GxxExxY protein [Microvirga sp. STR05]|uniref:GxxExxY protein n=1 Tax=Hymenobacter duratus TaxID=2771356 RepID=A0ABR8JPD1_9BACT|nr:GxxExxY protein [Hymenobacter duratus]MBD2716654.1 GxxExxY protein [Hymenobacter duratus]MBR7951569.1 GxxExxY protein [Microvirga sp. STR05]
MDDYKYKELTGGIIGAAMRVHTQLGVGFPEVVYQRCLAIELRESGLAFEREVQLPLFYRGEQVGSRRVDFLVEKTVLVELKAVSEITSLHHAQILNYLHAYKLEVALLLNFGEHRLAFKRFINSPR